MPQTPFHAVAALVLAGMCHCEMVQAGGSTLQPIGPFTGSLQEDLSQFASPLFVPELPIFGDEAAAHGPSNSVNVLVLESSILNGDAVTARSIPNFMGVLAPATFEFSTPLSRFGAWFNNNSGASDATIEFFGPGGSSIGSVVATIPVQGNTWTWNGWQSDQPITRLTVTGNGLLHGFIWYDDLQGDPVPAPAGLSLIVASGFCAGARRRRS